MKRMTRPQVSKRMGSSSVSTLSILEVCHPRCVCENWKWYVVKHNSVN